MKYSDRIAEERARRQRRGDRRRNAIVIASIAAAVIVVAAIVLIVFYAGGGREETTLSGRYYNADATAYYEFDEDGGCTQVLVELQTSFVGSYFVNGGTITLKLGGAQGVSSTFRDLGDGKIKIGSIEFTRSSEET